MPRDKRVGGKKTSSNGVDNYYNKRNEEMKSNARDSTGMTKSGKFDDLYDPYNRAELQSAQFKSILSGVPIVGPLLQGVEGAQQLEDLYNQTGKVPAYPTLDGRASGIGYTSSRALDAIGGKILGGAHDLYQFYAGEPDSFRGMMNNSYM